MSSLHLYAVETGVIVLGESLDRSDISYYLLCVHAERLTQCQALDIPYGLDIESSKQGFS